MAEGFTPSPLDRKVPCAKCGHDTWHDVVGHERRVESDEYDEISVYDDFRLVKCRGCGFVSFEHSSWCTEDFDEHNQPDVRRDVYPKISRQREPGADEQHMPAAVRAIYRETLTAYNAGLRVLAAVGVRGVVEAACKDRGCTGRDLKVRINALVPVGALSQVQADFLHELRFMGNDAVHEVTAPTAQELLAALEIVENLLRNLYQLPALADAIKAARQARKAPGKPAPKVAKKKTKNKP